MGWRTIKGRLATPWLRRLLGRQPFTVARDELARKFLRGDGLEIGALNAPLPVPWCTVRYVDCASLEGLRDDYSQVAEIRAPDIVADLETLDGIDDACADFVIANHVLEHLENPLQGLAAIARVLRPHGVAFIALPDKRWTFDKPRAVTPLCHIVRDFNDGPHWSRSAHYRDWARHVERADDIGARAADMERCSQNIHFHVWDPPAMRAMFKYARALPSIGLTIAYCRKNRGEVIWILRK